MMSERIFPDFSIRVTFGDEVELVNRVYDRVDTFHWLGHSIVKLVTSKGFMQWHTTLENGLYIAEQALINPNTREEIAPTEHEGYLKFQEQQIEGWLGDGGH